MSLIGELKRRGVIRIGLAYLAASWLLVQVAATVLPAYDLPSKLLTLLIACLAIGFIPVVVLSWKFDVIAGRLMRDDGAPAIPSSLRRVDVAITALLLVGLSYFAFDKFVLDPARDLQRVVEARQAGRADAIVGSYGDKSIAVLPFVNMSADPEQEYFSDGISEELLNTLARIPELRVISRSTAFSFKGKDIDVTEVAKRLNVGHVLEGSVRKSGNRIRITAQLIDARTDTHLWSETYDRDFDDIFNIQDEISARVVADLKLKLLGGALQSEAVNPAAYELYLKARQLLHYELGAARSAEAAGLLEQAVELEPSWQRALFELTRAYYRQTFDEGEDGRNRKKTVALIERLEALDKRGQAALIWRGYITWLWEDDAARAAVYFEQAVAADPYGRTARGKARSSQNGKSRGRIRPRPCRNPSRLLRSNACETLMRLGMDGEACLLGQQSEHLANIVAVLGRNGVVLQQIKHFA
jgi:TolB-like protein